MAITKELNTSFGCSAEYHRITNISINYKINKVIICVASYLTKETRRDMYNPIEEIDIEVPQEDFNLFLDANVINISYTWLKDNVIGFEEAIDDLEKVEELKEEIKV